MCLSFFLFTRRRRLSGGTRASSTLYPPPPPPLRFPTFRHTTGDKQKVRNTAISEHRDAESSLPLVISHTHHALKCHNFLSPFWPLQLVVMASITRHHFTSHAEVVESSSSSSIPSFPPPPHPSPPDVAPNFPSHTLYFHFLPSLCSIQLPLHFPLVGASSNVMSQ